MSQYHLRKISDDQYDLLKGKALFACIYRDEKGWRVDLARQGVDGRPLRSKKAHTSPRDAFHAYFHRWPGLPELSLLWRELPGGSQTTTPRRNRPNLNKLHEEAETALTEAISLDKALREITEPLMNRRGHNA